MKKFYKYLLLIISLLLSSCNDEAIYFNYDEMIDKVVKIEVVQTSVLDYPDEEHRTHLLTLDKETTDEFLVDLSKIKFVKSFPLIFPGYPDGITFWIYYDGEHGDYDYINYRISTYKGKAVDTCGSNDWYEMLVDKYYYQII